MGRPIVRTVTLVAAVPTGYATAQMLAAAGPLALNGSLGGVSGGARRVVVHSNGNDSALTITVVGTNRATLGSQAMTETMAGGNASDAVTTQDFETVTGISFSGATAAQVFAGTGSTGSGTWVPMDVNALTKFELSVAGNILSGAPTWQIDVTFDDVYLTQLPSGIPFPRAVPWPSLTGRNADGFDVITQPVRAARLTLTAVPGSVQATFTQQGN